MTKVLNQGCRLEVKHALPNDEPLQVSAYLSEVREEAHKVRLTTRIVTGTARHPASLIADVYAVVPTGKKPKGGAKKDPPVVPEGAKKLADRKLGRRAGLEFALLTGDFNPIHWVGPYAKVAGFRSVILHGFGSMAIAWEAIVKEELGGDASRLKWMDLRFVRPQFLPGTCSVFVDGQGGFAVGKAPGERATTLGTYGVEDSNG
jgi:acyl dehydratase